MKDHFVLLVTTTPKLHDATRELATKLATRANAVLFFLHVLPMRSSDGEGMLYSAITLNSGQPEAWLRRQLPSEGGVRFRHRLEVGEPEEVVARFTEAHIVDMVVVEEPPRTWVSEAIWRGLAERLIRRVDCPVVIGGPGFLRSTPPARPPIPTSLGAATVAELLNAMVDARVDALRSWMDHVSESVRRVASSDSVRSIVAPSPYESGRESASNHRLLRVQLDEHRRALRAIDWQLITPAGSWGSQRLTLPQGPALVAFLQRVEELGHSTSLPLSLEEGSERLVILAGAQVREGEGGALIFAFDAEDDFLRILGQPGPLPSFETYAFDDNGLMLSNSRFPEHLRDAGLLPADGGQTPLRLRVAEPSEGPIERWPLTHMATQAIQTIDGWDTRGYRDYRGTPVVGAWRWVPEYGFGVTAEVDRDAAFR